MSKFLLSSMLMLFSIFSVFSQSEELKLILGETANKHYIPRIKAVHKLGRDLQPGEVSAIYKFLRKKINEDSLKPLDINAIKNDLVIVIMKQRRFPNDLTANLVDMYDDKAMDDIWRDYCIQFLGQWYPKIKDPKEAEIVRKTFQKALLEKKNNIAGTALIAVSRLTQYEGIDKEEISQTAFNLATEKDSPVPVKITALQIAANLGNKEIIPIAKNIIKDSKNIPLKTSAIAAIGKIGNSSDITLLEKYSKGSDVRLRAAAKAAIKKLEK